MQRVCLFKPAAMGRAALKVLMALVGLSVLSPTYAREQKLIDRKVAAVHSRPIALALGASSTMWAGMKASTAARGTVEGIGVVVKLGIREDVDAREIVLLKSLGVTDVIWTPGEWANNETSPGKYALQQPVLKALASIRTSGMRSVIVLFRKNPIYSNPLDEGAFARYCGWLAKTLANQPVAAFEIWNEPSNFDVRDYYGGTWNARGNEAWLTHFVKMMTAAAEAIRASQPHATIIVSLEGPPLLRALTQYPTAFSQIDGVSLHPYPGRLPPERVPWGGLSNELRDGVTLADGDGSLISTVRIQTRDAPENTLGRPFEAWITEYGYPTCSPTSQQEHFVCVSPTEQAAYLTRGLILGLSQKVALWSLYELADEGINTADPEQNFGLVKSRQDEFTPKPAFYAVQRLCHLLGSHWERISHLPDDLMSRLDGGQPWLANSSSVEGPQLSWFRVENGYIGFFWQAGVYQKGQGQQRLALDLSSFVPSRIQLIDLVTGVYLKPTSEGESSRRLRLLLLPISSNPVALHIITSSVQANHHSAKLTTWPLSASYIGQG